MTFLGLCFFALNLAIGKEKSNFVYPAFQSQANIQNEQLYDRGEKDFVQFWAECASDIDWFREWDQVLDWKPPYAKWFQSGQLNVSYNCLDRHILAGKGDKNALIWCNEQGDKRTLTYEDLYKEVNKLANIMKQMGVEKGDRVAIYMPMVPEALAAMLASSRIGAVHSVIFGGIGAQSVKDRVNDAEAKLLITADGSYRAGKEISYKSQIDEVLDDCSSIQKTLVLKHTNSPVFLKEGRDYWYHELMESVSPYCEPEKMDAEDPLFILYTSGTTGKPKGILHTTGGYLVGVHTTFKWVFDIKPQDVYWSTADIGWITGHSFVTYGPLSNGVTQVIYEGAFDTPAKNQFAKIIDDNHVTIFYTAPTLVRMFMKWGGDCLQDTNLDSLRLLGTIGEPINPEAWLWYHKNIGHEKCPIVDTWFQTETGGLVISPLPGVTSLVPGTVTKALPGYDVAVLDEEGNPSSSKGFLSIRKPYPSMMRGLYRDHDRYVSTYWSKWDGKYYFVGDAASCDEQGYFWIHGRCDEVLKISGHRIGSAEVENALIEHTAVSESAVVGVKDDLKGEKIVAFVILKDDYNCEDNIEEQLKKTVASYLGSYARPEKIVLVKKLPKTRSGKILRRVLKNLIEGQEMGNVTTLSDPSCLEELIEKCQSLNTAFFLDQQIQTKLSGISQEPCWKGLKITPILRDSQVLSKMITPLLREHLKALNYDRAHLVGEFLDFYEQMRQKSPSIQAVDAMIAFNPDMDVHKRKGGSCLALTRELSLSMPKELNMAIIPAVLSKRFQQRGWSKYSHSTLIFSYQSPNDPADRGYVFLEPSFDIDTPIILKQDGTPFVAYLKERGRLSFRLEGEKAFCVNLDNLEWGTMVYDLKEFKNPAEVAIKAMIACDRRISLVSRNETGEHKAHININLDHENVTWSINYKSQDPITFVDFMDRKVCFDEDFAQKLNYSAEDLNELVAKIIKNKSVLDQLKDEYFQLIQASSRKEDFFL
ncbi:MAG: acetate--CoA ligase [Chlamydiae bacterium]|nr:MAG: acetate--CoA ligase [Chlamydiota bacterium]